MSVQNFIKLSAAVHELSWSQSEREKNSDENITAVATEDSKNRLVAY